MYINITDSESGNNNGCSSQLVHYLDKENRLFNQELHETWFSNSNKEIPSYEVRNRIDCNIAKLSHSDAKFFLINISPSQKEIAHLISGYGEKGSREQLKVFAGKIMDEYARNFKRQNINTNTDLLWFGKLENHRYYSFRDKEVKNGLVKAGELKPGEQMHVQVIVSRKDITNRIKLSPMNKSRGRNKQHSKKVGEFDRVAFKASGERVFDEVFGFVRPLTESFAYANTQVNGNLAERIEIQQKVAAASLETGEVRAAMGLGQEQDGTAELNNQASLLELILAKPEFDPLGVPRKRKKRRKGMDHGINF